MSGTLKWQDGGESIIFFDRIPTGPYKFHCQAHSGDRTYSIRHESDGWLVMQSVRGNGGPRETCETLEAAKEQAEQWEARGIA